MRRILLTLWLLTIPASAEPAWHGWLVQGRDLHCCQKGRQEFSDRLALFNGKPRYRGHYSVAKVDLKTFAAVEDSDFDASAEMSAGAKLWPVFWGKRCVDVSQQFPVGDESRCYRVRGPGWFLVWRRGRRGGECWPSGD